MEIIDPVDEMNNMAARKIKDPLVLEQYTILLEEYLALVSSYGQERQKLYNSYSILFTSYDSDSGSLESDMNEAARLRQELRSRILDLEEEMRDLLTEREWKQTRHRSLIVLSEYYLSKGGTP
ncbi:MAG: hypothetical protein PQJ58_02215 [Spirochaetales bacterium]|nr:hypothetical protein [Spirochaetales bacterium]